MNQITFLHWTYDDGSTLLQRILETYPPWAVDGTLLLEHLRYSHTHPHWQWAFHAWYVLQRLTRIGFLPYLYQEPERHGGELAGF